MSTDSNTATEAREPEFRLFIAFTVPEEVRAGIEQLQDEMRRRLPGQGFRWTKQTQFHLTLVFLGNVAEKSVSALSAAIENACRPFPPLVLRAEAVGVFPRASAPRVVWVGIHNPAEQLAPLQESIQSAVAPFSKEELKEDRFRGHVTRARIKDVRRSEIEGLKQLTTELSERCLGEWRAKEVELIRSQLSPKGSTYTTLFAAPLRRPSA